MNNRILFAGSFRDNLFMEWGLQRFWGECSGCFMIICLPVTSRASTWRNFNVETPHWNLSSFIVHVNLISYLLVPFRHRRPVSSSCAISWFSYSLSNIDHHAELPKREISGVFKKSLPTKSVKYKMKIFWIITNLILQFRVIWGWSGIVRMCIYFNEYLTFAKSDSGSSLVDLSDLSELVIVKNSKVCQTFLTDFDVIWRRWWRCLAWKYMTEEWKPLLASLDLMR